VNGVPCAKIENEGLKIMSNPNAGIRTRMGRFWIGVFTSLRFRPRVRDDSRLEEIKVPGIGAVSKRSS
jgi:hypothetical protein